ncbi:MAG: hypothetical protein EBZ48_07135 [Proteobacteria bacterium]|nr:hypothetical protein [Pseudomonadota bacterium]
MLVLVPQSLRDSPYGNSKHALKIVSRIVCEQLEECHRFRASFELKGKPLTSSQIFGGWANILSSTLKGIASGYRTLCESLERDGFIQRNAHYSNFPGKSFPYSFRLHSHCWNDRLTLCRVHQRLSKRTFRSFVGECGGALNEQYLAAERHLAAFSLPEDCVTQLDAICEDSSWPDLQRNRVARLCQADWWSNVDSYGRYHTPLTNLSKGIRSRLLCNGQNVVGFDFANFQPSLLSHLNTAAIPEKERDLYFTLCKKSQIYEYMAGHCPLYASRTEAKEDFLAMLNKTNTAMRKMPLFSAFEESFPTYTHLIQQIKKEDHRNMARFLQRTEAEIMFGGVVRSFRNKSDAPFFTVHDGIYTGCSEKNLLKEALQEVIDLWSIPTVVEEEESPTTQPPLPIYVGMNFDSSCLSHPSGVT